MVFTPDWTSIKSSSASSATYTFFSPQLIYMDAPVYTKLSYIAIPTKDATGHKLTFYIDTQYEQSVQSNNRLAQFKLSTNFGNFSPKCRICWNFHAYWYSPEHGDCISDTNFASVPGSLHKDTASGVQKVIVLWPGAAAVEYPLTGNKKCVTGVDDYNLKPLSIDLDYT